MLKPFCLSIVLASALSGCSSTPEDLSALPDSYFESKRLVTMSKAERAEWAKRQGDKDTEARIRSWCVFGSHPSIDRAKLQCENIKGSPEYKAKHGA